MSASVERSVADVRDPDVRSLVAEAWSCYGVGAYRACIALTWAAVCADLIGKLERLADEGEGEAQPLIDRVGRARAAGLTPTGVLEMQEVERDVVGVALRLELLDAVTARELGRLRDDRHVSVHTSARPFGEPYLPTADYARAHLAAALAGLLTLPATQGRRVIQRFTAYVGDTDYVKSSSYTVHTFYEQVKPSARRRLIELSAKHALLELPVPEPMDRRVVANRMSDCLHAFAQRDRAAVREALGKVAGRFSDADGETVLLGMGRAGDLEVFWETLPGPLTDRLTQLVDALHPPTTKSEGLSQAGADILSIVASAEARARVPALVTKFEAMGTAARAAVMARRVNPYFLPYIPPILSDAWSFRSAESLTYESVLPYAPLLDVETLERVLSAWATNPQCRTADEMRRYAVDLYQRSAHLRPNDAEVWQGFLQQVRSWEDAESLYRYVELEAVLTN